MTERYKPNETIPGVVPQEAVKTPEHALEALLDADDEVRRTIAEMSKGLEGKRAEYGGMTLHDLAIESDLALVGTDDHGNRFRIPRKDFTNFRFLPER